jgi:arylsulfatase A-like enzyme
MIKRMQSNASATRATPFWLLLFGALIVVLPVSFAEEPERSPRRKNVLFISIDDLKPLLSCYGHSGVKSPAIDRLASRGTLFTSAYCQVPLCAPTRASLLTGLRPDSTRVYFNPFKVKNVVRTRMPDVVTLPQHFRSQGYITCAMGKVFDGRTVDKDHDAASWSDKYIRRLEAAPGGMGFRGYQNPETQERLKTAMKASPGKHVPGPAVEDWEGPDNIYIDGAMARTAVQKIEEYAKRPDPFFLAVGFIKPHLPFIAPKKYWDLYDPAKFNLAPNQKFPDGSPDQAAVFPNSGELRDYAGVPRTGPIPEDMQRELIHAYAACVSYIDAQVALMVQALKDNGLEDDTIICLWGDHGWHLGEHGHWGKSTTYEDATRSPLIIYAPGVGEGVSTKSLVELLDIYPTLCELAGVPTPSHVQGKSLLPVMRDPKVRIHDAAISQSCTVDSQMSNQLVGGKIDEFSEINAHMGWALRTDRYRYVEWRKTVLNGNDRTFGSEPVGVELYDYDRDPLEKQNLGTNPAYAKTLKKHQALMDRLLPHLPERIDPPQSEP